MNRLKYILLVLVTIFIMIGVCGCMKENDKNVQEEKIKREALEYLNSNYLDTFTANVYTSNNWAYEYESITFTSEKFPDGVVEVRVNKSEDGKYYFKDNYYHFYMLDSAINYGKSLVMEEDVVVKARFLNSVWSDELSGAQSFEEWKTQGTAYVDFFIITGTPLASGIQENIVSKIATDKVSGTIVFVVTNDKDFLQDITLDDILNNQSDYVVSKNEYYIDSNFKIEKN